MYERYDEDTMTFTFYIIWDTAKPVVSQVVETLEYRLLKEQAQRRGISFRM